MQKTMTASANERYHRVIEQIDNLPALPSIVTRLIRVVNSPDTSAEDAASLIERDPALTTKMLRLANSAFYGIPRSISSVSSAVVILGFNTIRSLVLSASVMKMFSGNNEHTLDKERFWKHSIVCALAAKIIVRHFINVRMMDPESAFCAGILHDIGKLIFNEFAGEDYKTACEYAMNNNIPLLEAERIVLGIDHAQIGRILADKWALPLDLEYSIVFHHSPGEADKLTDLVTTVHFADIVTHQAGLHLWDDEVQVQEWAESKSILRISDSDMTKIMETLQESVEKSLEFFNIIK
ncbi:MAG: HDOD domain-containing protein [Chitinispirillaceae bacterium]|nr:HDOD domain-containing protein [Chitinispirillaceae bacterium]